METNTEMMSAPTQDTQAILLLCAKLGQRHDVAQPLTTRQYAALARWLHERSLRPSNLLRNDGRNQLSHLHIKGVDKAQVERLLDRGAALGLVVERWTNSGIWIVSRGDEEYPVRYKTYLQHAAPPLLYGVGNQASLQRGGLAIVGSRRASEEDVAFAQRLGKSCAEQKIWAISGAAKGIDAESMMAAIDKGGYAIGVLADGLGRAAVAAPYHDAILEGRLTLLSPYEPDSHWFAFAAMERNKLIYALGDAAIVVASSDEQGGTWAGAVEALKRGQIPIYIKALGEISVGNRKLIECGGQEFPAEAWHNLSRLFEDSPRRSLLFNKRGPSESISPKGDIDIQSSSDEYSIQVEAVSDKTEASVPQGNGSDAYSRVLEVILHLTADPLDQDSIARKLDVVPSQAKAWLDRAVQEGKIQKLKKPIRYVRKTDALSLFPRQEMTASRRP